MPPENVSLPGDDGLLTGYLVRPARTGPFPAVVVIHEILGMNDNIKGIAESRTSPTDSRPMSSPRSLATSLLSSKPVRRLCSIAASGPAQDRTLASREGRRRAPTFFARSLDTWQEGTDEAC